MDDAKLLKPMKPGRLQRFPRCIDLIDGVPPCIPCLSFAGVERVTFHFGIVDLAMMPNLPSWHSPAGEGDALRMGQLQMSNHQSDLFPRLCACRILKGAMIIDMARDTCTPWRKGIAVKHQDLVALIANDDAN